MAFCKIEKVFLNLRIKFSGYDSNFTASRGEGSGGG